MDRYEYKIKLDEMKSLLSEKRYEEAVQIAETINWKKVKQVSSLCLAGEIFEKTEHFEDAKDTYLMAYDRTPIGRNIVFRLTMVSLKAGNMEEAEDFLSEFIEIAPNDSLRFLLRYQIAKAKGAGVAELISILEELKEEDSSERWNFELATLYHKAGMAEKCVDACDELILWFGDGNYVEKALELKMLYQPLTRSQERVYKKIREGSSEDSGAQTSYEELQPGETIQEEVKIPTVTTTPVTFDTINLQQELASNMKQIMEAKEKKDVSSHMESIKKLVQDIPYLKIPEAAEDKSEEEKYGHIETDEEIDGSLKINFKEMLGEDMDGQISLNMPETKASEPQITGQMSIEDVLSEWEKTKRVAQAAMEEADRRKLESAKARALQEAEDIMDRLQDVIPQLENGKTPEDLMKGYLDQKEILPEAEPVQVEAQEEIEEEATETAPEEVVQENMEEEQPSTEIGSEATKDMSNIVKQVEEGLNKALEPVDEKEEKDQLPVKFLTEEQKEIFSYFVPVPGMEKQLCQVMSGVKSRANNRDSKAGNIMITGGRGSGKTVLATNLVRVLQKVRKQYGKKVGKISATALNKKDVVDLFRKMSGGYLIIEQAGELSKETATKLSLAMDGVTDGVVVIIEDTRAGIEKLMINEPELTKKFTEKLTIPIFTNDELVSFARSYANELEYEIDEMAILALYNRINNIQKLDRATTLTEVKEIVDGAIEKAEKGGFKSAFSNLFTKRYSENDFLILQEKDFEVK